MRKAVRPPSNSFSGPGLRTSSCPVRPGRRPLLRTQTIRTVALREADLLLDWPDSDGGLPRRISEAIAPRKQVREQRLSLSKCYFKPVPRNRTDHHALPLSVILGRDRAGPGPRRVSPECDRVALAVKPQAIQSALVAISVMLQCQATMTAKRRVAQHTLPTPSKYPATLLELDLSGSPDRVSSITFLRHA